MTLKLVQDARAKLGQPRRIEVVCDGDRDIAFVGWQIGHGEHETSNCRITEVNIFATQGGLIVTQVRRFPFGREHPEFTTIAKIHGDEFRNADEGDAGDQALVWLMEENRNSLGSASKVAWREACANWPPLSDRGFHEIK